MGKIKLPVYAYIADRYNPAGDSLYDADDETVDLRTAADIINATARRCDGCRKYAASPNVSEEPQGWCSRFGSYVYEDDCCRNGWEPKGGALDHLRDD